MLSKTREAGGAICTLGRNTCIQGKLKLQRVSEIETNRVQNKKQSNVVDEVVNAWGEPTYRSFFESMHTRVQNGDKRDYNMPPVST